MNPNIDPNAMWNGFLDTAEPWLYVIGGIAFLFGLYKLVSGFQQESPKDKSTGLTIMVSGALWVAGLFFIIPFLRVP